MKLPLHVAEKLLLLEKGEQIPASKLKSPLFEELIAEGILYRSGIRRGTVRLPDGKQLYHYLLNHCSISNLQQYIETLRAEESSRQELVRVSGDSKAKNVRSFKGFLINSNNPIRAKLNGQDLHLDFAPGTFRFVYDYEEFYPEPSVTIVGIENPECFRHIDRYASLFENISPLFVSRYPQHQSKDLIKWLQTIPNNYLHFGDLDFAGINIYMHEFKTHLGEKARFCVPPQAEELLKRNGNRERYNKQRINFNMGEVTEKALINLISLIHKYQKGMDQEGIR